MPNPATVAVLLAEGFEEIEAVSVIDVLRRAEVPVVTAAVNGTPSVTGAHGITLVADIALDQLRPAELAMVVLPGGLPGSTHLATTPAVGELLRQVDRLGGFIAAICAAPMALHAAGLLQNRQVTCYPGVEARLDGARCTGATVQRDDRLITSRGPGTSLLFALELVRALGHPARADQLRQGLLVQP